MGLTPSDIRSATFKRASVGRRGYDEADVDIVIHHIASDYATLYDAHEALRRQLHTAVASTTQVALIDENSRLTARVQELENDVRGSDEHSSRQWKDLQKQLAALQRENDELKAEAEKDLLGVSSRAVNLLSQAQLSADNTIDEAEQYARDLVVTAREQYRDILLRAQEAGQAQVNGAAGIGDYSQPISEIEYVRTYAQVAHAQLMAVLETLATEVDKLGSLPQLGPGTSGSLSAKELLAKARPVTDISERRAEVTAGVNA
ncbi:DivIVA domain-containing protein [Antrihabitans cavernicola]|nr:DivIVA domain-containing protein [Spelaeibacter cavernicola]